MAARGAIVQDKPSANNATNRRGYWQDEITKGLKRWNTFYTSGSNIVDRYRLERQNSQADVYQDRYNILYSSTETAKPSLYAQTPKAQAVKRHKDRQNDIVTAATMLLETTAQYAIEEVDFDGVMKNVVQDFLLPGMGTAWVRYVPTITTKKGENDNEYESLDFEGLDLDYVHFKDFLTGVSRVWKEMPWVARRVYFTKARATKRWGEQKAAMLQYSYRPNDDGTGSRDYAGAGGYQAIIWEIWDKINRKVVWYTDDYAPDVLEEINDPLHLKDFFPCPEPVRAVWTTKSFIPKGFYSEYKAQAEELDNITERIRYLTQALRVIGVYDSSQEALQQLLTGKGNKMVPVESWAQFAGNGGIQGSVQYVPIKDVATVLTELMRQRELVKSEIYEISGFSDIQRGVSKASETLGAQEIKNQWASGRLRDWQKEIQRFCRDLIRIMSEIISEQFSPESLALYSGFDPPEVSDQEQAAAAQYVSAMQQYQAQLTMPQAPGQPPMQPPQKPGPTLRQQAIQTFAQTVKLLKSEKTRCAQIGIETDSTIQPDEAAEREARMNFLASAGAFLQQAAPAAQQFPAMAPLLGAILMFTVRTFPASRPIEKVFEDFVKQMENSPPPAQPQGEGGGSDPAAAQAKVQSEQVKAQAAAQAQAAELQATGDIKRYEIDKKDATEREKLRMEQEYRMAEIAVRVREVAVKEAELGIKQQEAQTDAALAAQDQQHQHTLDAAGVVHQEREFEAGREDADRSFEQAAASENQA